MITDAATPELGVVIGCDADPDRPRYGGTRYDSFDSLRWRGLSEGIAHARMIADEFADASGKPLRITWCIRADAQIEDIYGCAGWCHGQFAEAWGQLEATGDELAWHPHLWRWDDGDGYWYQEIEDVGWIEDCLTRGHHALAQGLRRSPRTSRMGWEFHNNASMNVMRKLKVAVDFSAIPGRFTPGGPDRYGSDFLCHIDWRGTPEEPYVPSYFDYRQPAGDGEGELVELPMSVFRSPALSAIAALRRIPRRPLSESVSELSHLSEPLKAYITGHPYVFGKLAASRIAAAREQQRALLVTAFHPDELLSDHAGMANSGEHFRTNVTRLVDLARRREVHLRFLNAAEALDFITEGGAAAERRQYEVPPAREQLS